MIIIQTNRRSLNEKEYIFQIVFKEFLNLKYRIEYNDGLSEIILVLSNQRTLKINSIFFNFLDANWGKKNSLPTLPLKTLKLNFNEIKCFKLKFDNLPIIYGTPNISFKEFDTIESEIDFFGSMFFMLSRYEEIMVSDKDKRDRVCANSSIAFQAGFLLRPIVNEYLELLWCLLKSLDNSLIRKIWSFKQSLTCDVDWPYNPSNKNIKVFFKSILRSLIKEKQIKKSFSISIEALKTKLLGWKYDSHNTFSYLMDIAEENLSKMYFYFLCDNTAGNLDGNYSMSDNNIEKLLLSIKERGHEIGLHGSYNTYMCPTQIIKEVTILKDTLRRLNINQKEVGSRQHYLRINTEQTFNFLDRAGIDFDSSLSFADCSGFRTGTCYEYSLYDLKNRHILKIKERPLIAMEASIISSSYMNLGYSIEALNTFINLKNYCKIYGGEFVLLWHNSFFFSEKDKIMLEAILKG